MKQNNPIYEKCGKLRKMEGVCKNYFKIGWEKERAGEGEGGSENRIQDLSQGKVVHASTEKWCSRGSILIPSLFHAMTGLLNTVIQ